MFGKKKKRYDVHLGRRKGLLVLTVEKNSEGSMWSAVDYSMRAIYGSGAEVAAVHYQANMMRVKGPRKMAVGCPSLSHDGTPHVWFKPREGRPALVRCLLRGPNPQEREKIMMLTNKSPVWNAEAGTYSCIIYYVHFESCGYTYLFDPLHLTCSPSSSIYFHHHHHHYNYYYYYDYYYDCCDYWETLAYRHMDAGLWFSSKEGFGQKLSTRQIVQEK